MEVGLRHSKELEVDFRRVLAGVHQEAEVGLLLVVEGAPRQMAVDPCSPIKSKHPTVAKKHRKRTA